MWGADERSLGTTKGTKWAKIKRGKMRRRRTFSVPGISGRCAAFIVALLLANRKRCPVKE
jgi:hypothetical protein